MDRFIPQTRHYLFFFLYFIPPSSLRTLEELRRLISHSQNPSGLQSRRRRRRVKCHTQHVLGVKTSDEDNMQTYFHPERWLAFPTCCRHAHQTHNPPLCSTVSTQAKNKKSVPCFSTLPFVFLSRPFFPIATKHMLSGNHLDNTPNAWFERFPLRLYCFGSQARRGARR